MIKVGILGASGYAANELVRLLLGHKEAQIIWLGSQSSVGKPYHQSYQNFFKILPLSCIDASALEALCQEIDVLFCATPHNFCAKILASKILESTRVIDLSADFRIKDASVFEQWYHDKHANPALLESSVYGLSELARESIATARLIANPGCYPTCSILALAPLLARGIIEPQSIIIDAKSGVSGAGRSSKVDSLFCEVNENFKAYGIASHRHTPEIEQALSNIAQMPINISFTPHLIPINRGILATIYATSKNIDSTKNSSTNPARALDSASLREIYREFYEGEFFVRVLDEGMSAQTRWVEGSNFIDIAPYVDARTNRIIITAAIDNLIKGAAGQAVQNMNIAFGLPESTALESAPIFP